MFISGGSPIPSLYCFRTSSKSFSNPLAALGAVPSQHELFAAEFDCLRVVGFGLAKRLFLNGQTLVIEQAAHFGREVIRALDGVMAGEKELESHALFLPLGLPVALPTLTSTFSVTVGRSN